VGKWKQVQKYAPHIPHPLQNYLKNKDKATHILLLDATFTKVKGQDRAIMIAYDTGIGVVDYWIDCTENKTAYSYIFQRLTKVGYKPICVVSDGHFSILPIIEERNLPHQRCIFHLLKGLRRTLMREGNWMQLKDHVLCSRIKGILKTNHIEDLPERVNQFRHFQSFFPGRAKVFEWFWDILPNAMLHLSYAEDVPRTTAKIENFNGQIKQRLKTMRGMKSEKSLNNLLKILFYFRKYK
jgi:transposase-like protein